jgi:hypothetical protein
MEEIVELPKSVLIDIREKVMKFILKVDSGSARSTETYKDMKDIVSNIDSILSRKNG